MSDQGFQQLQQMQQMQQGQQGQQGMQQPMPGQQGMPMQPGFQQGRPVQAGQGYPGVQMPPMQTQAARFQKYQPPQSTGIGSTQQFVQKIAQDKAAQAAQHAQPYNQFPGTIDGSRDG